MAHVTMWLVALCLASTHVSAAATGTAATPPGQFHPGRDLHRTVPRSLRRRLLRAAPNLLGSPNGLTAERLSTVDGCQGGGGLRVSPSQFGGDPTGRADSTAAVHAALQVCVNASLITPGTFPDLARDAGGCTVDLGGGEYTISSTLVIPTYVSNLRIGMGTLRANPLSWNSTVPHDQPSHQHDAPVHGRSDTEAAACSAASFPRDLTGLWCQTLTPGPAGSHSSEDACMAACCGKASCGAYQYCSPNAPCASGLPSKTEGCWLAATKPFNTGLCKGGSPSEPKTVGWTGRAYTPPPPPPWVGTYLIQVGGTATCVSPNQGSCTEDIGFPGLTLIGSHVAAGIQINQVMGTTVGPQSYLLNFTGFGVQVNGGHEVMIIETWAGQTNFDYNYSAPGAMPPSATAIALNSNDHYIQDSIVFSSLIGLANRGAANMVTGLHVWFPNNAAGAFSATAFLDTGHQNRYEACYVDCSVAVFVNPSSLMWTGGIILGGRGIEIQGAALSQVRITNNQFDGGGLMYTGGIAPNLTDVVIDGNVRWGHEVPATRATVTQVSTVPRSNWTLDFCDRLAFGNIATVTSVAFTTGTDPAGSGATPAVVAREPVGCTVTVAVEPPTSGTLAVSVDESSY